MPSFHSSVHLLIQDIIEIQLHTLVSTFLGHLRTDSSCPFYKLVLDFEIVRTDRLEPKY